MANTHYSGPVNSENGFKCNKVGQTEYSLEYSSDDLILKAGSNEALRVDADGKVQITTLETDLVVESGLIKQEDGTGTVELTGGDAAATGANLLLYGDDHATQANDFSLRAGSTDVITWDQSGNLLSIDGDVSIISDSLQIQAPDADETLITLLSSTTTGIVRQKMANSDQQDDFNWVANFSAGTLALNRTDGGSGGTLLTANFTGDFVLGRTTSNTHRLNGGALEFNAATAGTATIKKVEGTGAIVMSGGTSESSGGTVIAYGATHSTQPSSVHIRTGSTTRIEVDGTGIGFFGATPAAQAAAYTPTNVTPDRSFDADTVAITELADIVGTLIADLQSYGLLQ